jgi:hypothetical protein
VATIFGPCYCTRESVMRALDVKAAGYNKDQVDRCVVDGTDSAEMLLQRRFYPWDDTRSKDWPNYDYSNPWRVWLDNNELADVTVNPPVVTSGGVLIPDSEIYWGDPGRPQAPYTYFELQRQSEAAFGNGPTPQREIVIQGTFGYQLNWQPCTNLEAAITTTTATTLNATSGTGTGYGCGDLILIDSERMIVQDAFFMDTTVTYSGLSDVSANDNVVGVPSGAAFTVGEVLQVDIESLLVQTIQNNNLIVKRAYDGSILAAHSGGTLWARRQLQVLRGQLGTVAATHLVNAPVSFNSPPGLVRQLSTAEAIVGLAQEPSGYAGVLLGSTSGQASYRSTAQVNFGTSVRESVPGPGLPDLRDRCFQRYGRKVRSRAI